MRGERGLADIFQTLQLTNENPLDKKDNRKSTFIYIYIYIYFFFIFFFQSLTKSHPVMKYEQRYTAEFWSKLWLISSAYRCGSQNCLWCDRLVVRWRPAGDNNSETEGIFLAELQSLLASELIYTGLYEASHIADRTAESVCSDEKLAWFELVSAYIKSQGLWIMSVMNETFLKMKVKEDKPALDM